MQSFQHLRLECIFIWTTPINFWRFRLPRVMFPYVSTFFSLRSFTLAHSTQLSIDSVQYANSYLIHIIEFIFTRKIGSENWDNFLRKRMPKYSFQVLDNFSFLFFVCHHRCRNHTNISLIYLSPLTVTPNDIIRFVVFWYHFSGSPIVK